MNQNNVKATLDANVLYPAPLRDLLLNLADLNTFQPFWSERIQNEWIINLLKNRPDLKRTQLERTRNFMNLAFPNANIDKYENIKLIKELPDQNDKHVLQVAIKSKSQYLVTQNIQDFPKDIVSHYNIKLIKADNFIAEICKKHNSELNEAVNQILEYLRNPPITKNKLLEIFNKLELYQTIKLIK